MKKFGVLLAFGAAVALIGCGGGGGGNDNGNDNGGNNGTPTGESIATANIPTLTVPQGQVNVSYVPRQGRLAEVVTAFMSRFDILLGEQVFSSPLTNLSFPLTGSEVQTRQFNVPTGFGQDSRLFDGVDVVIDSLSVASGGGEPQVYEGDNGQPLFSERFDANIRLFPGRETGLQLFLNEGMINFNDTPPSFRRDVFQFANDNPNTNKIEAFLADYVMFDVSGLGNARPNMSNGNPASRIYISGDRVALSAAPSNQGTGYFEVLTESADLALQGDFSDPASIGNGTTRGTYRLVSPDPNDPNPVDPALITSLFGSFVPYYEPNNPAGSAFSNTGTFEVLLFPTSKDDAVQQMVAVQSDASHHIQSLWIGNAFLDTGTFQLFSLQEYVAGTATSPVTGTLGSYLGKGDVPVAVSSPSAGSNVRSGRYTFTSNPLPSGFDPTGRFVVYRA